MFLEKSGELFLRGGGWPKRLQPGKELFVAENDLYLQLVDMINKTDPHVIGIPNTPAMLKVLSLQFTPEEVKLALQVGTAGGTLSELSAKTGIDKAKLKKQLETMAAKGTMWIDPDKEDPVYRVVGSCAPGLVETGAWGGIRFPYDIELIKNLHPALKDWARERLCPLGFPFSPVFAHPKHLPADAKPGENIFETLKRQDFIAVSDCPCRLSHWLAEPDNHCNHTLQACIHYGSVARWTVKYGMARQITYNEAVEIMNRCHAEGLVHSIDIDGCICNCCKDCCPNFIGFHQFKTKTLIASPFVPRIDPDKCSACSSCVDACPVGAMQLDDVAQVNQEICIGCSVCVPTCDFEAIKMARRQ